MGNVSLQKHNSISRDERISAYAPSQLKIAFFYCTGIVDKYEHIYLTETKNRMKIH